MAREKQFPTPHDTVPLANPAQAVEFNPDAISPAETQDAQQTWTERLGLPSTAATTSASNCGRGRPRRARDAGYHTYSWKTAEQLAVEREKREQRSVEKQAQVNPLFPDNIRAEGFVPRRKGRPR